MIGDLAVKNLKFEQQCDRAFGRAVVDADAAAVVVDGDAAAVVVDGDVETVDTADDDVGSVDHGTVVAQVYGPSSRRFLSFRDASDHGYDSRDSDGLDCHLLLAHESETNHC